MKVSGFEGIQGLGAVGVSGLSACKPFAETQDPDYEWNLQIKKP